MSCKLVTPAKAGDVRPWAPRLPAGSASRAPEAERRHREQEERERAAAELQQRLDQEWQQGFAAGQESERREEKERIESVIGRVTASVADLATVRWRIQKEAEAEILKLVFGLARRVVRRELTIDPNAVAGILRAGLDRAKQQGLLRIKAHASVLETIRLQLEQLGLVEVELVADPELQPGDVLFETERGTLDARVESQFQEIEKGLADRT